MIFMKMNFYPFTLYVNFFFTEAHHKPFPLGLCIWVGVYDCVLAYLSYSRRMGVYSVKLHHLDYHTKNIVYWL